MSAARADAPRRAGITLLRALRSTVVIGAVAFMVTGIRTGRYQWADAKVLLAAYWDLLIAVFFGLLTWEYWIQRIRRARSDNQEKSDGKGPTLR